MSKYISLFLLIISIAGCSTSVKVPEYIQGVKPYTKTYFSGYADTLAAAKDVLVEEGWTVAALRDPLIYERNPSIDDPFMDKIMIVTDVKESGFFVGTRYSRLNVYLHAVEKAKTSVEIRFLTETALPYSSIRSFDHEFSAQKILTKIEEKLTK